MTGGTHATVVGEGVTVSKKGMTETEFRLLQEVAIQVVANLYARETPHATERGDEILKVLGRATKERGK